MSVRTPSHLGAVVMAVVVVLTVAAAALALSPLLAVFGCVSVAILGLELTGHSARAGWIRLAVVALGVAFFGTRDPQLGAAALGCAGLVVTQATRDRALCLGLAPAVVVLILAGEPGSLVTMTALLAGTAALGGGLLLHRVDPGTATVALPDRAHRPVRSALRAVVWPVLGMVALTLGLFLLLPQPQSFVRPGMGAGGLSSATGGATSGTRPTGGYVGGPMNLSNRGPLPDTPIFSVSSSSPRLWRVSVLDSYDGRGWRPYTGSWSQDLWAASAEDATYDVHPLAGYRGEVPAPGALVGLAGDGQREAAFGTFQYSRNDFQVTASPYADVSEGGNGVPVGDAVDNPQDPRWTALPGTVTTRTRALASRLADSSTDPAEVSQAIRSYLTSGEFRYDLNAPVAPEGRDAVDYLLFDSRTGFCEHYASAEVVMLRSLGIPARVAVGYSGGKDSGDIRTVTAAHAHAWVEVYVAGRGWVTSDPTPAGKISVLSKLSTVQVQRAIGVVLVLAALVGLLLWLRRDRRPARRAAAARLSEPAALALVRLGNAMKVAGVPTYQAQTVADIAVLLPHIADDLRVLERQLYGGRPVAFAELQTAIEAVDRASGALLALSGGQQGPGGNPVGSPLVSR